MMCTSPRLTMLAGSALSMRSPSSSIAPDATLPSSVRMMFETDFSVVLLPAPLPPSSTTHRPAGTSSEIPLTARITSL